MALEQCSISRCLSASLPAWQLAQFVRASDDQRVAFVPSAECARPRGAATPVLSLLPTFPNPLTFERCCAPGTGALQRFCGSASFLTPDLPLSCGLMLICCMPPKKSLPQPPYNPSVRDLVAGKRKRAKPLSQDARDTCYSDSFLISAFISPIICSRRRPYST